jgi:HKD family nuclease
MRANFHFQDPTDPDTKYLTEAILEELENGDVIRWRVVVAFATPAGVSALWDDPVVAAYCQRDATEVIVGLDAITTPETLDRLAALEDQYARLEVLTFQNELRPLFHPKVMLFQRADASGSLIVGSGNLTIGGLFGNFEGFTVIDFDADEADLVTEWDTFRDRHDERLWSIDDDAYEMARRNLVQLRRRQDAVDVEPDEDEGAIEPDVVDDDARVAVPGAGDRVLVAQVPRAGARWHQVGLNEDVVRDFFQIEPNSTQRLQLRHVRAPGVYSEPEIRGITMSYTNRNRRLEIGARRLEEYPGDPPILVFRERGVRQYDYVLVFPGEAGYEQLARVLRTRQTLGSGAPRVPITADVLLAEWPESPLLHVE